ncbi:MAG TPA: outer membrane beta-barrel protein [Spirochaetota bacterium]
MKRIYLSIVVLLCSSSAVFAFGEQKNIDVKITGGYASYPDRPGFGMTADYQWVLDPFFSTGLETGFFWVSWKENRGKALVGQSNANLKATTNAFSIPVLAIAQVRLQNIKEKLNILPYATIGLGYSFMPISYSDPSYTDSNGTEHRSQKLNQLYHGFTWELIAGAAYSPVGSKIDFFGEFGYIGSNLSRGNLDIDMSRYVISAGVRFAFSN